MSKMSFITVWTIKRTILHYKKATHSFGTYINRSKRTSVEVCTLLAITISIGYHILQPSVRGTKRAKILPSMKTQGQVSCGETVRDITLVLSCMTN